MPLVLFRASRATTMRRIAVTLTAATAICIAAASGHAADFTITGPDTTARTLGSASGQTGNVTASARRWR